jgi:DNA-binding HxlR family transcriptional regulator
VGKRSYDQYCTVARALDVVGERWTLLLVRELLTGPRRFKDLLGGLPGIGTNLLAARLRALEGEGVVRRATLPPPAGSSVYELTELGRSLGPVITTLSRWGSELLGDPREGDDLRPAWAATALQSVLEAGAVEGLRETYEFRIDGETFHARVEDGKVEARQGPAGDPDLVVAGDTGTLLAVFAGRVGAEEAMGSGSLRSEGGRDGGREALARCLGMIESGTAGTAAGRA